ncbi:MAG: hypothetical protein QXY83_02845 [Thermosphaera sp.]
MSHYVLHEARASQALLGHLEHEENKDAAFTGKAHELQGASLRAAALPGKKAQVVIAGRESTTSSTVPSAACNTRPARNSLRHRMFLV